MASLPESHGYHRHRNRESMDSTSSSDVSVPNMGDTPPTRQLDFYQAMRDFRQMFPNMEEEVIEAVLRANNGAVDPTIEQLLSMNVDNDHDDGDALPVAEGMMKNAAPTHPKITIPSRLLDSSTSSDDDDLPPSYSDYAKGMAASGTSHRGTTCSPNAGLPVMGASATSTPPPDVPISHTNNLLDMAEEDLEWQLHSASGYTPNSTDSSLNNTPKAKQNLAIGGQEDDYSGSAAAPPMPPKMNLLQHEYTPKYRPPTVDPGFRPPPKRSYKHWNPPMLGTLPDDFLRIIITPEELPKPKPVPQPVHTCGIHSHFPPCQSIPHAVSHTSPVPPHHHHHHHHGHLSRSATIPSKSSGTPQASKSPQTSRSATMAPSKGSRSLGSGPRSPSHKSRSSKLSRSASASQASPRAHGTRTLIASHGSEELDSGTIQMKIVENERKQSHASNPEQAQILADEHLALMMQNEEFLQVLRHDEDFMRTLERDRMNATAFEPEGPELPELDLNQPRRDQIEGYGHNHQEELGAFPFVQPMPGSDNAEFRRQLNNMGGSSRKKFAALAKKFFTRKKKKTPKQLLKDSVAPSTANLLEEEEDEEESPRPEGNEDKRFFMY